MPAKDILFVRLTDAERRRIRTLAVSQGLTMRQAILQAFEAWAEKLPSQALTGGPAPGTLAGANREKPGPPKSGSRSQTTSRQGRRPADEAPALALGGKQVPSLGASSRAWIRRAGQLDWSKCPAAERAHAKTGDVWVARGTRVPVAAVLDAVAEGESFVEIAEVFEITLQQLIAILQFAVEGVAPAGSGK